MSGVTGGSSRFLLVCGTSHSWYVCVCEIILNVCVCLYIFNRACACYGVFQRQAYPELSLSSGQLGIDDHAHIHPGIHKWLNIWENTRNRWYAVCAVNIVAHRSISNLFHAPGSCKEGEFHTATHVFIQMKPVYDFISACAVLPSGFLQTLSLLGQAIDIVPVWCLNLKWNWNDCHFCVFKSKR